MRMWEEILCTGYLWCLSNAFYNLYTKVAIGHRSLYGRNNVNPLIYITVSWLVHMCKQDIGIWKVIARTYQGSWSRRGELCYQLHKAIPMTQPSFWGYQIFMKKWELFISAKFEQICIFWKQRICKHTPIFKFCIWGGHAYVWKVKFNRSYGVFWLYLDAVLDKPFHCWVT